MKSDNMREATVQANGSVSVPAAGYTGASALITGWIDTADIVGPVVIRGYVEQNTNLSGTLSIESAATSAAVAANAGVTVTDDADFPGGRDAQGVNATGGKDFTAANGLDGAISYRGSNRYVRGHLTLNNASSGAVAADVALVALAQPQVVPDSRADIS